MYFSLQFSDGLLAANYGPDWPGIMALLAGDYGHMHLLNTGHIFSD